MGLRLLLLLALTCPGAFALEWHNRVAETKIAPLQAELDVEFSFTNRGTRPVRIVNIQSNCDCLDARADKQVYAPGERGTINARFTVGDRLGLYERAITVRTDDEDQPVRLAVRVEVPAAAEVSPRTLEWNAGDPAVTRTAVVTVADGLAIDFNEVVETSGDFAVALEPVEAGRAYRVTIAPNSTERRTSAAIRINGREKSGRAIVVSAYAYVR